MVIDADLSLKDYFAQSSVDSWAMTQSYPIHHGDDLVPPGLPLSRASLIAASFASVPLLQKKHWPPKPLRSLSAWASSPCGSVYQVLGTWMSFADLLAHRLDDARRTVAEQVAAPAGEEVEVAVALGVPDVRPLAAHQADRDSACSCR